MPEIIILSLLVWEDENPSQNTKEVGELRQNLHLECRIQKLKDKWKILNSFFFFLHHTIIEEFTVNSGEFFFWQIHLKFFLSKKENETCTYVSSYSGNVIKNQFHAGVSMLHDRRNSLTEVTDSTNFVL